MSRLPTFDPGFSTDELTRIFSAGRTVEAMLEFEAALALALADTGIAPSKEAEDVASACRSGVEDPDAILASTWSAGTPLIALREVTVSRIENENARRWFHFGATSQDTIDTAHMLQAAEALDSLITGLTSIASRLRDLTLQHKDEAHGGRTFLQDARPTTFGFRTATWLDAVLTHIEDLRTQRASVVVQLGGPVGTMENYGEDGPAVMASLATHLGLGAPDISWHGNRTRIRSLVQSLAQGADTMAKIGTDVALLTSSGISEIRVRSGGSSSMPGKENPVDSMRAIAAAGAGNRP
jgi:3-carboxy-cis,cis-muconate cycloisomerase